MLTLRRLSLSHPQALPSGPVLPREILENSLLAEQLLDAARAQAQTLLDEAREAATRLQEEARASARAEVWRQADALLSDWQEQRQRMWEHITATAEALLGQAWRQLTGEQDEPLRIAAVIRQLAAVQASDEAGVLHCHPDGVSAVSDALQHLQAAWSVRADPQLAADTVCLRTEQGEFSLGWSSLSQALWPSSADAEQ